MIKKKIVIILRIIDYIIEYIFSGLMNNSELFIVK